MVMDDAETSLCEACRQSMGQLPDCWKKRPHRASNQQHTANNRPANNQQQLININELLRLKVFNGDG
jgi:hypothetical protein